MGHGIVTVLVPPSTGWLAHALVVVIPGAQGGRDRER